MAEDVDFVIFEIWLKILNAWKIPTAQRAKSNILPPIFYSVNVLNFKSSFFM